MALFWKALRQAYKKTRAELELADQESKVLKVLQDDPITIDILKKIAVEFAYHFEIARPDGTIFRFYKRINDEYEDTSENGGWGR